MPIRKVCALALCLSIVNLSVAQTAQPGVKPGAITKVTKFKPPVVSTFLGRNAKTAEVTMEEAVQLVSLPLKISDEQNNIYTVSSYQFMYKRKSTIENEKTGKREITFTTVADLFKTTPLPQIWRTNIGGSLQKGEELYFFDIIVKDKSDRKFFAPDVKIIVR